MWKELYLHIGLDMNLCRMVAMAYTDRERTDQVECHWETFRPHCGGLGCVTDYQNAFRTRMKELFSQRTHTLEVIEDTL
jgi:hypothetical protein